MDHRDIITALRNRREAKRLSQATVAKRAGLSRESVSDWERGKYAPGLAGAVAWAEALGCELVVRERA